MVGKESDKILRIPEIKKGGILQDSRPHQNLTWTQPNLADIIRFFADDIFFLPYNENCIIQAETHLTSHGFVSTSFAVGAIEIFTHERKT